MRLKDDTEHQWAGKTMLAHPSRPLTREQHLAKFRRCVEFAVVPLAPGAADRLVETVDRLETVQDVRILATLGAAKRR